MCDRKKGQQPNKEKSLMIHHTYSLELLEKKLCIIGETICALLEKKLKKSRAQSLGLESLDLVDAIPRYEMWKAARTKSDGQMTSQSAQIISQKIVSTNLI